MGADGGSIPTRVELVKGPSAGPSKSEKKDSHAAKQEYNWSTDPVTQKPLQSPIVSDALGRLFNKETIIEYLVGAVETSQEQEHTLRGVIKTLKDVVELHFKIVTEREGKRLSDIRTERWVCPLNENKELGPENKSVYIVPCGHVFAESELKNITEGTCPECNCAFTEQNKVSILPDIAGEARLLERAKSLKEQGLAHSLKKASKEKKKEKKRKHDEAATADVANISSTHASCGSQNAKHGDDEDEDAVQFNNPAIATLAAKVRADQEEKSKKRKLAQNDNVRSLFSTSKREISSKNSADFMTRGFAVNR